MMQFKMLNEETGLPRSLSRASLEYLWKYLGIKKFQ
jgi:hypothetical protein